MLKYYISEFKNWLETFIPTVINEKNFLLIVGSLFLLGFVTKWIVIRNYAKLIKKAEDVNHTKNATIRQIKIKYDSIVKVNGKMDNPMLFVQRNINKCKMFHISVSAISNIINWCALFIIAVCGIIGYQLYQAEPANIEWVTYLFLGSFMAIALEMVNRAMPVNEKKTELVYAMVDVLLSSEKARNVRETEAMEVVVSETEHEKKEEETSQEAREEQILNQVIGEFLQ